MISKISIAIGLLVVAGLTVTAFAASQGRNSFKLNKVSENLELDQQQQAELQNLFEEMSGLKTVMQEQRGNLHNSLQEQLLNEQFDTQAFQKQLDDGFDQFKQALNTRVQKFADFHASLNLEQREKLVSLMQQHQSKHQKGKHQKGKHKRWGNEPSS